MIEAILAASASTGVHPEVVRDLPRVRAAWRSAPCVVVSVEMAAAVCGLGLEPRSRVHLVGDDVEQLAAWSPVLEAAVLALPQHTSALAQALGQGDRAVGQARVVRVVSGSGGLGVSTLCCALAQQASARGLRSAVVELDPEGGGLDLLFGAENAPGWRWHDLRSASGRLERLDGNLPNVSGVDIVAHAGPGRAARGGSAPRPEAVASVLQCLSRTHDLVVLDAGHGNALSDGLPGQRQLLAVGADVRAVMAARARAETLGLHDIELVVRTGPGRRLAPQLVAETLGVPLLGEVGQDLSVVRAAEQGRPLRPRRWGHARQVARILDALVA